ncbi:DUF4192 domain-containing protein [Rhodococcus sp. BP22]|uniref:DUF4192 domain-containing protein n=1 Tax=Rhodococcus sp. BP22 TaxID=2758566 RepID=UPI00164572CD|nr:DUF4192 domain-containing protein [Rhodococcus sp. BP22]
MTTFPDNRPTPPMLATVSATGDLIAAIPAMLGFAPSRSLLLICLDGRIGESLTIGTVMRHDLSFPDPDLTQRSVSTEMADVIDRFAALCLRDEVRKAIAVIVDDGTRTDDGTKTSVAAGRSDARYQALGSRLEDRLQARGTHLLDTFLTANIAHGCAWISLTEPRERGTVSDPRSSAVTLAYVLGGRAMLDSREALEDLLQPLDTEVSRQVRACIGAARDADMPSERTSIERILQEIGRWAQSPLDQPRSLELSAVQIAEFGVSLTRLMVRDSMLALVLHDCAATAEQLWSHLSRTLPAPERACPATLLGFSAYSRGDGVMAGVAIELALAADPDYSLARLLDSALNAGARPEMIREVALSGYAVAELCGVRLSPPTSAR